MKTLLFLVFSMILGAISSQSFADKEVGPTPFVTTSLRGQCYFKLVPDGDRYGTGHGAMYLVEQTTDTLLYKTDGWFADQMIVADWRYIARVVAIGRGSGKMETTSTLRNTPPDKLIALAFYENGKLLKQYTVHDLMASREKMMLTMGHYSWFKSTSRFYTRLLTNDEKKAMNLQDSHGFWLLLETLDGNKQAFNMRTGERCENPERTEEQNGKSQSQ